MAPRSWWAVDVYGRDLATGGRPASPGADSPAAALAAAPVVSWPMSASADDNASCGLGEALGPGGSEVERMLDRLWRYQRGPLDADLPRGAEATPAGTVTLPLALVSLTEAIEVSAGLDQEWAARLEALRSLPRHQLLETGRGIQMEAALHVTMLLATECLDPTDDADVAAHMRSGAQLWLLTAAVVWALAGATPNPFSSWAELITSGLWPIGPCNGRLIVADAGCS